MSTVLTARVVPPLRFGTYRAARVVERNLLVYRRAWTLILSGAFEPLFYLLTVGVGIGDLVNATLVAPSGEVVSYTTYVAPALLASSAMNGAVFDATFNVFFKLKYAKTYDALLKSYVGAIALADQRKYSRQMQLLLLHDTPVIFPYFNGWLMPGSLRLHGFEASPDAQTYLSRASLA